MSRQLACLKGRVLKLSGIVAEVVRYVVGHVDWFGRGNGIGPQPQMLRVDGSIASHRRTVGDRVRIDICQHAESRALVQKASRYRVEMMQRKLRVKGGPGRIVRVDRACLAG